MEFGMARMCEFFSSELAKRGRENILPQLFELRDQPEEQDALAERLGDTVSLAIVRRIAGDLDLNAQGLLVAALRQIKAEAKLKASVASQQ